LIGNHYHLIRTQNPPDTIIKGDEIVESYGFKNIYNTLKKCILLKERKDKKCDNCRIHYTDIRMEEGSGRMGDLGLYSEVLSLLFQNILNYIINQNGNSLKIFLCTAKNIFSVTIKKLIELYNQNDDTPINRIKYTILSMLNSDLNSKRVKKELDRSYLKNHIKTFILHRANEVISSEFKSDEIVEIFINFLTELNKYIRRDINLSELISKVDEYSFLFKNNSKHFLFFCIFRSKYNGYVFIMQSI